MKKDTEISTGADSLLNPSRRQFIKKTAVAAAVAAAGPSLLSRYARAATGRTIKIGLPTPMSGPLAEFSEPDNFVLAAVQKLIGSGLTINGTTHPIQIITKDTRSDPNRASEVASSLIKSDKVDLIIVGDTPEVVNPVADQAEVNGVPCVTSGCPWQVFFFGRGGKLPQGFNWTYHFFWGIEDLFNCYADIWSSIPTNKVLGGLWPNDTDGIATAHGEPSFMKEKGFTVIDPGRFETMTPDFTAQINKFKQEKVEIVTGVIPPPAFITFWSQAAQQGFKPKIVTVAKAALFPSAIESYGDRGLNLSTEVWWSPFHPFKSSLTGQTSQQLCDEWEKVSNKQWTAEVGFKHAMLEVALDVLKRTKNVNSAAAIRDAIQQTNLDTIAGHVQFGITNKNVSKTPLVGGQWVPGKKHKYDLVVVNNQTFKTIPTQATLKPLA